MNQIKNYYAGSNSSQGFYSLFDEVLEDLEHLYILKGGPGTGKSTLIKQVGDAFVEKGLSIEFVHCSSDNGSLDGVIVPALKAGVVDGTSPHIIDPKYPGVVDRIVNLGDFRDDSKLTTNKQEIIDLTDSVSESFANAYDAFREAKKVHDELEAIYLSGMSFTKADHVTEELIGKIFPQSVGSEPNPDIKRCFPVAATPKGPVQFIDHLTEDVNNRYILKGRAGSGKSTMMKKIGKHAENLGLNVWYYHCAFDPESLDMVIIPVLETAVLDGTAPHVIEPNRSGDEVIDMFDLCIDKGVEEDRGEELHETETNYKILMKKGTDHLMKAKKKHDKLEQYYVEAMDFAAVQQKGVEILNKILSLSREDQPL